MGRKRRQALRRAAKMQRTRRRPQAVATPEHAAGQLRRMIRRSTERISRHFNTNPNGLSAPDILAAFGPDDASTFKNYLFAGEVLSTPKPRPQLDTPAPPAVMPAPAVDTPVQ